MSQQVLGVDLSRLRTMPTGLRLTDRQAASTWLSIPIGTVNRMVPGVTRLVADLPTGTTPEVVWTSGAAELLVHTDQVGFSASPGVLQVGITVECDQVAEPAVVTVSFVTGTVENPRGLFLATFERPAGPAPVVAVWADALTAFAWESVITLATTLAAAAGQDAQGRALVPGMIAASRGAFQVLPMPRTAAR
jgi:hypothetical protein